MKKFLTAILVLVLLAGCVGGIYSLSGGFKDWKVNEWFNKEQIVPPATTETTDKLAEVASVDFGIMEYKDANHVKFPFVLGENDKSIYLGCDKIFSLILKDAEGKDLDINNYNVTVEMFTTNNFGYGQDGKRIGESQKITLIQYEEDRSLFIYGNTYFEKYMFLSEKTRINFGDTQDLYNFIDYHMICNIPTEAIDEEIAKLETISVNFNVKVDKKIVASYSTKGGFQV